MRTTVEFYANLPMPLAGNPADWAREREAEGWHGICASDHLWVGQTVYPHVFVVLATMAAATTRIRLTSSFANNLFRSPVEFAQASLTLNMLSGGRFEPGLGAGWMGQEMVATGRVFPDGPTRVSMYREALTIVRDLLRTGTCRFKGEHYSVDITDPPMACVMDPPPDLIGSASGPRALREITPLVDRLEITAAHAGLAAIVRLHLEVVGDGAVGLELGAAGLRAGRAPALSPPRLAARVRAVTAGALHHSGHVALERHHT